jgi:hypothetical protein
MNRILQLFLSRDDNVTVCYFDDVMIATKSTNDQHYAYVGRILPVLQANKLVVKIDMYKFH